MTRVRTQGGGSRQRIWNALRQKTWPSATEMARALDISESGARGYILALKTHGYVEDKGGL